MIQRNTRRGNLPWTCRMGVGLIVLFAMVSGSQATPIKGESFATPELAVAALVAANQEGNTQKLLNILGPRSEKLIFSGDAVADREGRKKFLDAYALAHKLESDGEGKRILVVGEEQWPLPLPIVRAGDSWHFDTAAGEEEILNRRIGRNELSAIGVCRAYVEAQREYAEKNSPGEGNPAYARKFRSTPGKHDGLYWRTKPGEEESPFGPLIATAEAKGHRKGAVQATRPYHGYYYKILPQQGGKAVGGTKENISTNRKSKGFALIAFPARYGISGVMTFLVNEDGIVYEKNIGPETARIARKMMEYNPDSTWKIHNPVQLTISEAQKMSSR